VKKVTNPNFIKLLYFNFYRCAEELSGIFVKSVSEGSAADVCRKIQVNDRIVEVDSQTLQGFNNHQAVEVLRATGQTVSLRLERYLRGPKFEQLQQAIANSEVKPPTSPNSHSFVSLPHVPLSSVSQFYNFKGPHSSGFVLMSILIYPK